MPAFTIDAENNITVFASLKESEASGEGTETFSDLEELAVLALSLPGFRLTRVDVRSEWLNGFLHPACDWMGLFFCSRGNLSVMDKIFAQHADFGDLHLETRCIDDQWEWQVMAKGRGRIASDKAKSLERAQEAAKNAAGAEEVEWRSIGSEVPPGPVA